MVRQVPRLFILLGLCGFLALYIPVVVMMVYSFNAGKLSSVWAGFSWKWYGVLFGNEALLEALGKSLLIAGVAASLSTIFGVLIAACFVRFGRFRGRLLLSALASAPLVIPEVVMGFQCCCYSSRWNSCLAGHRDGGLIRLSSLMPPLGCVLQPSSFKRVCGNLIKGWKRRQWI